MVLLCWQITMGQLSCLSNIFEYFLSNFGLAIFWEVSVRSLVRLFPWLLADDHWMMKCITLDSHRLIADVLLIHLRVFQVPCGTIYNACLRDSAIITRQLFLIFKSVCLKIWNVSSIKFSLRVLRHVLPIWCLHKVIDDSSVLRVVFGVLRRGVSIYCGGMKETGGLA